MFTQPIALLDLIVAGAILGANAWFFFVQSPVLIAAMGREDFVPIQMRLTRVLFRVQAVAGVVLVVLAWAAAGTGTALGGAILAAVAALITHFYVIPRALRAGGKGRVETKRAGGDSSVAKFASEGSGPSAKFWHRTVVVFVVIILVGVVVDMAGVLG